MDYFTHTDSIFLISGVKNADYVLLPTKHRHTFHFCALMVVGNKMVVLHCSEL